MVSHVARSQGLLAFGHVGRLLMFVVVAGLLGRLLAPVDFAFVSLVSSLYIVAMAVLDMGSFAVATRQITAQPGTELTSLRSLLALRRWLALVMLGLLSGLAMLAPVQSGAQTLVLLAAAGGIFLMHLHGFQLVLQLRQCYGRPMLLGLAAQLAFLLGSGVALKMQASGAVIAAMVVLREAVTAVGSRWLALGLLGVRLRVSWFDPGMLPLLRRGWMIGVAGVSYKLAVYSGIFGLYQPDSAEALARFSAAHRLLMPMVDLAWLVAGPLFASIGLAAAHSAQAFRDQLAGHVTFALGLASLLAVAAFFVAPWVIRLLYGDVYSTGADSAIMAFRWLAFGGLFAWVTPVLIVAEITLGHERPLLLLGLSCLLLAVLGNAWAIPRMGAMGASLVLCLCEVFVFCALLARLMARREIRLNRSWLLCIAPALALAAGLATQLTHPVGQLVVAFVGIPAGGWLLSRLPAQRVCRDSIAREMSPWFAPSPSNYSATQPVSP